ncbi:uncharacterized protein K460DRAFT_269384 [Cucurbitaria berberidis CBS 394.84]|uniref:Malate dehydrogenase n=1 Tax=Cucurbitaria berberidis CBS 394.84 TaxID=1168544 RepID=A0A9P4GVR2_9PLEO|nr:uncharacterized protein K460DRAFT_269384 [Cucurbitaria berberidis CBS 394.84]KAF1851906.1 hypothetical protein K460DRAFT_269384 [Cucurbitaria berberidis CBS 394.84]
MHASLLLTAIALLPFSLAAPAPSRGPPSRAPRSIQGRQDDPSNTTAPEAASCDLRGVSQPSSGLTPPAADLQLILVALGQGTQNYSCGANTASAPTAIGAVAQLFNASCAMSSNPTADTASLASVQEAPAIGAHFFVDNTTPDFDIIGLGNTQAKKVEEAASPQPSANVKWLRLQAQTQGSTSSVKQIYRLNTVGGVAPSNCEGHAAGDVVTVQYEAQYWVYA